MPAIINSDDGVLSGSSGLKTSGANDGITAFQQNGTESVRITAAGNVGVGNNSPTARLDVVGSTGILTRAAATQDGVELIGRAGGTTSLKATITPTTLTANRTLTLPDGTGTVVVNNVNSAIVSDTAKTSTSGTFIDFTGIPSWVRRVTVMFSGVSVNGSSVIQIQIGTSGGVQTTGYAGSGALIFAGFSAYASNFTSGFGTTQTGQAGAGQILSGSVTLCLLDSSNGTWVANGLFAREDATGMQFTGGKKTLSGTLDRVRVTTVNGTDAFDAGSINILYE